MYLRKDRRKLIHVEQLLDMLHALSGDKRFEIIKEQYLASEDKEECDNMCLLLDMCEEEGMQKGLQKGMQEGLQEGMQKGLQKGMQEGILLATQVIRLNSSGKSGSEISEELGTDLNIVEDILSSFHEFAEV